MIYHIIFKTFQLRICLFEYFVQLYEFRELLMLIKCHSLSVRLGKRTLLSDISMTVSPGEIISIIGYQAIFHFLMNASGALIVISLVRFADGSLTAT
jgi:hypothetical protein